MDCLPDDVLLMIFELLSVQDQVEGCARVCWRWRRLVTQRAVRLRSLCQASRRLSRRTRRVLVLASFANRGSVLQCMLQLSPMLYAITIHGALPLDYLQLDTLRQLPHLRHLDVFTRTRLLDGRAHPLFHRLHTLVINNSSGKGLFPALARSTTLRSVHMYGRALHYPPGGLVLLLSTRRTWLTDLTLRCHELPDRAYEALGACENLAALRLYSCWLLTSAGVEHVVRPPRLRVLHVTGARLVRSTALAALVAALPTHLVELALSVSCFDDEHAAALAARVPRLRVLELWRVRATVDGMLTLAARLPELRALDLDRELPAAAVRELCALPSLETLRCMPGAGVELAKEARRLDRVRVTAADVRYERRFFREDGEGYRGGLYYYWTQDRPLVPLPENPPPECLEPDDLGTI